MQFQTLSYSQNDSILHVKLNRPEKRNAIDFQMFSEIEQCFFQVATQPDVKVVLLSGSGKGFSAGTDLIAISKVDRPDVRRFARLAQKAYNEIEYLEKVVIALIHGFCFGIGLELALACDLRICSDDTLFNLPEVKVGLVPDGGASQRLPRIVGLGRAKELILTGETIDAATAERWGMVNKVVKLQDLESAGIAWSKEISNNGLVATGLAKKNIDLSFSQSVYEGLEGAATAQCLAFSEGGFRERIEQRFSDAVKEKKA
jgi:enoyl-CoA hydratase/carnithine racemase